MRRAILALLFLLAAMLGAKGQPMDTLRLWDTNFLYQRAYSPNALFFSPYGHSRNRQGWIPGLSKRYYASGRHTAYGIAVTAASPVPEKFPLQLYHRQGDTLALTAMATALQLGERRFVYTGRLNTTNQFDSLTTPFYIYLFHAPVAIEDTFYIYIPLSEYDYTPPLFAVGISAPPGTTLENVYPSMPDWAPEFVPLSNADSTAYFHGFTWGCFFPLVGLPCPSARAKVRANLPGSTIFEWTDAGTAHQLEFRPEGDSTAAALLITDSLTDPIYTLSEDWDDGWYTVRSRKTCHYSTLLYDTVLWSGWSPTVRFYYHAPLAAVEPGGEPPFLLAPNPATGSVTVTLGQAASAGGRLTLTDLDGRTLREAPLEAGSTGTTLDVSHLPSATYILRLATPRGTTARPLIVAH